MSTPLPPALRIVEGNASVWHYHLSETGLSGQPAVCGERRVMLSNANPKDWGLRGGHVPCSYCSTCEKLRVERGGKPIR